jgi:hypothetical protein
LLLWVSLDGGMWKEQRKIRSTGYLKGKGGSWNDLRREHWQI